MHLHPSGCKHEQRHSSKITKVETWITARKAFCKNQAINKPLAQRAIAHKNARQKHILLAKLGQVKHWSRHTLRKSQECNARSGGHWFTEFCNSQRLSRFAAPFTGARAKISIAESCGSWNNALPRQLSLKQLSLHSPARWTRTHGHRATLAPAQQGLVSVHLSPSSSASRYLTASIPHSQNSRSQNWISANDPSAGSPTETLLRLLLPLSDKVHETFRRNVQKLSTASVRIIHRITQSVGATGGVYKGQGRNQHELMTRAY